MTELADWLMPATEGWVRRRIRTLGRTGSGSGFPPSFQGQVDLDIPFYKVKHLGQANPDGSLGAADDTITHETAESLGATVFPAGTLVYAKVGAALMLGRVRVLPVDACIDNNMAGLCPSDDVDARFLYWAMTQVKFDYLVNPGAVPSLSDRNLLDFPLLLPDPEEQRSIANYLDRETARIDALIEEQQRLIEMLRERRQAVVDEATVGLDEVTVPLRRAVAFLTSGSRGWGDYYADEGERFLRIGNLPRADLTVRGEVQYVDLPDDVTEGARTRLREGDLLFSITAYLGSVAVMDDDDWVDGYVSQHVALCRLDRERLDPRFVGWVMLSTDGQDQLKQGAAGGTKVQLSLDDIRNLSVPVPPLDEQRRIVAYLGEQTTKIDTLIAETERFIELSRERRAALITAAVTGRTGIRGRGGVSW